MEEESIIRDSCVVGEIGSGCFREGCEGFLKNRNEVAPLLRDHGLPSKLSDYTSVIINIGILIPITMDISKNNASEHSRRMGRIWRDVEEQVCWFLIRFRNIPFLISKAKSRKSAFKARSIALQWRFLKGRVSLRFSHSADVPIQMPKISSTNRLKY
jgi:hypothetical protein